MYLSVLDHYFARFRCITTPYPASYCRCKTQGSDAAPVSCSREAVTQHQRWRRTSKADDYGEIRNRERAVAAESQSAGRCPAQPGATFHRCRYCTTWLQLQQLWLQRDAQARHCGTSLRAPPAPSAAAAAPPPPVQAAASGTSSWWEVDTTAWSLPRILQQADGGCWCWRRGTWSAAQR